MGLALEEPKDDDERFTVNGINFGYEEKLKPFLSDLVLDFVKSLWGTGFTLRRDYSGAC